MRRCASLPRHSAIFYLTFGTDAAGGNYADERVLADLHATANAPLFSLQSVMLGTGIVGGTLMANDQTSRNIADAAIRLLNGEPPRSVRVPPQSPGPPLFDWRELQRWGIPESRLPAGERRPLSGAERCGSAYRGTVLSHRRRAGRPVAPDRRAPVSAPRATAGRERQPEEPGARRRRRVAARRCRR